MSRPKMPGIVLLMCLMAFSCPQLCASADELSVTPQVVIPQKVSQYIQPAQRILMLGDSITYSGQYVVDFETWLSTMPSQKRPLVINCGLSSETVSCLSEEGHADGKFPRPCLHERLDRVLQAVKPDLVIACYGMNCGIYKPLAEERLEAYQNGIDKLKENVEAQGATLILVTPPFYDQQQAKSDVHYEAVLKAYSQWLVGQRSRGWNVIDLHTPMAREIEQNRQADPDFTVQKDAVHPNSQGHWMMARAIIQWFDPEARLPDDHDVWLSSIERTEQRKLISKRMGLLRNSFLSAAKHVRPGVPEGKPVDQALAEAEELTGQIHRLNQSLKTNSN